LTAAEFQLRSDAALSELNTALIRAAERFDFEPDFQAGALKIDFEDPPGRFVVSPNAPVSQVWVSALVKSYKLDWSPARNAFVLAASGQTLLELLADLIGQQLGETVAL
jgi:CyaY protein